MKKILIISGIAVAVILIVIVAIYFFIIPKKQSPTSAPAGQVVDTRLQLTEEEQAQGLTLEDKRAQQGLTTEAVTAAVGQAPSVISVQKIADTFVLSPVLSPDGQRVFYYDKQDGEFSAVNQDGGNPQTITEVNFQNVWDVRWSTSRDRAIVDFSENQGRDTQSFILNLVDQSITKIDDRFKYVNFSPDGQRMAYFFEDPRRDQATLSTASLDGSDWRQIQEYRTQDGYINWHQPNQIAFGNNPTGYEMSPVYLSPENGGELRSVAGSKYGLKALFSPDGKKIAYSYGEEKNAQQLTLWLKGSAEDKGERVRLDTFVDKCAWADDSIHLYCGVPQTKNAYFILPDDWYKGGFITKDDFYKINTDTGQQQLLASVDQFDSSYDVEDPFISPDGKRFYFTRHNDGKLYALVIP